MIKGRDFIGVGAVVICHDGAGNYLFGLRSEQCRDEYLTWDPVGSGGVKFGESVEAAVRREVKEESGSEAVKLEYLGWYDTFREHEGQPTHWVQFVYKVEVNREDVYITEPEKCLEQRWCTIDDIPEPRHSQFPKFFEQFKDRL